MDEHYSILITNVWICQYITAFSFMPEFWNSREIGHGSVEMEIRMSALSLTTPDLKDMDFVCSWMGFLNLHESNASQAVSLLHRGKPPLPCRTCVGRHGSCRLLYHSHFPWRKSSQESHLKSTLVTWSHEARVQEFPLQHFFSLSSSDIWQNDHTYVHSSLSPMVTALLSKLWCTSFVVSCQCPS